MDERHLDKRARKIHEKFQEYYVEKARRLDEMNKYLSKKIYQ